MSKLPTWAQLYVDKENEEAHLLSQREKVFIEALAISIEALEEAAEIAMGMGDEGIANTIRALLETPHE